MNLPALCITLLPHYAGHVTMNPESKLPWWSSSSLVPSELVSSFISGDDNACSFNSGLRQRLSELMLERPFCELKSVVKCNLSLSERIPKSVRFPCYHVSDRQETI